MFILHRKELPLCPLSINFLPELIEYGGGEKIIPTVVTLISVLTGLLPSLKHFHQHQVVTPHSLA